MSLRWKLMLTFLVVIGASFAIMASILTGMVSSTLYQQRTRQATRSLEQLASSAAPFLASAQMDSLSELLTAQAGELGGRLLAVDVDGKVQADTFGARSGQRLSIPETVAVLLHGEKSAFGIHPRRFGIGCVVCGGRVCRDGAKRPRRWAHSCCPCRWMSCKARWKRSKGS